MDDEVREFTESVGAETPSSDCAEYAKWRKLARRPNYFILGSRFLVVKISRSPKPFWGLGKKAVDILANEEDWLLALLVSGSEGWVYSKADILANIRHHEWRLSNGDYKINYNTLRDCHFFSTPKQFLERTS